MLKSTFSFLILFALGVIASGMALAQTAFEKSCEEELPKTRFTLRSESSGFTVSNSVSSRVLNVRSVRAYPGELLMGMTAIDSHVEFGFEGPLLEDPVSSYECLAPHIEIIIRYEPLQVFIAREFAEGSCPYLEMLSHEMRHVHIYEQQLPKVEATVRAALTERFQPIPMYALSGHSKEALQHELDTRWLPFIRAELAKVEVLQAEIDSKEEYFRLSNACHGEVESTLGGRY